MMDSRCLLAPVLAAFVALHFAEGFMTLPPSQMPRVVPAPPSDPSGARSQDTQLSARDGARDGPTAPSDLACHNEMSRIISVSHLFGIGVGASRTRHSKKQAELSLAASPTECQALATRFRIANITSFTADVVVAPALGLGSGASDRGGAADGNECIQARGTIWANVTQTCVRTNEAFDISLEFSFDTVLRAMESRSGSADRQTKAPLSLGELAAVEAASQLETETTRRPRKKKRANNRSGANGIKGGHLINDAGMNQLSDILMEYEVTDEVIEDGNCFRSDGLVDCGEIAAQMFRLKLDPYPKKPGSAPVSYSFTF